MYCSSCGKEIAAGSVFCSNCGKAVSNATKERSTKVPLYLNIRFLQVVGGVTVVIIILAFLNANSNNFTGEDLTFADTATLLFWAIVISILLLGAAALKFLLKK